MAKDSFDNHYASWHLVLGVLGIKVNAPARGNAETDVVTLLESGFTHTGNPSHVRALVKGDQVPWWFRHFPASGSATA